MNIAFFTEAYKPYQSGVTISIDTFARDLVKLGHNVRVYAPAYPGYKDLDKNPSSFRFLSFPIGYPGFRVAIPSNYSLAKDIRQFKPDIIHAHHPFQLGFMARKWAKKLEVPLVYTFHTLFTEYLRLVPLINKRVLFKIVTSIVRNFCESCTTVIVPTEQARQHLVDIYQAKCNIEIIPTGMDLERFPKQAARKTPEFKKLIHVGRISREKNIAFLLAVMRRLPKEITLLIVGDGPEKHSLELQTVELGLKERVSFVGFKPREALSEYFSQADIFVTASKSETQGLVFMEAKVAGLPTVAINEAGAQNMVVNDGDGYLVEDDIAEFTKKIMSLYADSKLFATFSKAALEQIDDFSSMNMAKKLVHLYTNSNLIVF